MLNKSYKATGWMFLAIMLMTGLARLGWEMEMQPVGATGGAWMRHAAANAPGGCACGDACPGKSRCCCARQNSAPKEFNGPMLIEQPCGKPPVFTVNAANAGIFLLPTQLETTPTYSTRNFSLAMIP